VAQKVSHYQESSLNSRLPTTVSDARSRSHVRKMLTIFSLGLGLYIYLSEVVRKIFGLNLSAMYTLIHC